MCDISNSFRLVGPEISETKEKQVVTVPANVDCILPNVAFFYKFSFKAQVEAMLGPLN